MSTDQRENTSRPNLSVIVVVYNIPREAPRTLLSLSTAYQRHVGAHEYEVIVVDNGSTPAVAEEMVAGLGANFRLIRIDPAPPSPAPAVNRGLAEARGDVIGVMIDGARVVTPGLLHFARHGARLYEKAIVCALGWYLGYDLQGWATQCGYDQAREDGLLAGIGWPQDGYRLFEIGTMDESSVEGWFQPISEANALFMRRELWSRLGGMDEGFDSPGGGLLNLDTFSRALELPDSQLVILLGEGTFHQLHGGIATNSAPEGRAGAWHLWADQYQRIRGKPYQRPIFRRPTTYLGTLPRPALAHFTRAAIAPVRRHAEHPLGPEFDRHSWGAKRHCQSADSTVTALVDLLQREFQEGRYDAVVSVARLIRGRFPDELEPQRLLSLVAGGLDQQEPRGAEYFLALGEAHWLLGERDAAAAQYRNALLRAPGLPQAARGLAMTEAARD